MSAQPPTVLPWVVRLVSLRCVDCRSESATTGQLTVHERAPVRYFDPALLDEAWPIQVKVDFQAPVPIRPERLIAQGLDLSRKEVRRRIKCAIPLRRPTSAGFTFTVTPRAYQRGRRRHA
jgi:hypothetical protein